MSPSLQKVAAFRLSRHHLRAGAAADVVAICRDVCGVQAQVMSAAYLQLWARNPGISRDEIERALWHSRTLVKTSLMRQTLHLIPSGEFSIYIAALKASRLADALRVMARFGIARDEADGLTTAILESLSSGPLGQPAIRAAVHPGASRRARAWMERVWSIMRIPVALGLVCYGPAEGNEIKFIRVDQWLPRPEPISERDAQCALLRNYLRAYGPATAHDFSHWAGIPLKDCRVIGDCIKEELAFFGAEKSMLLSQDRAELNGPPSRPGAVKLLPVFDPFLLAHRKKDHLIEDRHYKRVYRNQGWISAVFLVDGRVLGTWSHRVKANKVTVRIDAFCKLSRALRSGIESEAAGLASFLDKQLEIEWASVR